MRGPPGTSTYSPPIPNHATWFEEKSGEETFCCAVTSTLSAVQASPLKMQPASNLALEMIVDIVALLLRWSFELKNAALPHLSTMSSKHSPDWAPTKSRIPAQRSARALGAACRSNPTTYPSASLL